MCQSIGIRLFIGKSCRSRDMHLLCAQFKEELMAAMGLNTEEQGSAMAFFRRGYRVCLPLPRVVCN